MRYLPTLAVVVTLWVQPALAADAAPFEWTTEKFNLVASGDSEAGKVLAKKRRCQKCHNETGVSDDEEIPSIAGQRPTYMYKQLVNYKNKVRESKDMYKSTKKLSDKEMVDIAAWFATQERPPKVGGESMLVIEVCDSCHEKDRVEEDGKVEVAPIIAGQIRQYLEANMLAFKDFERSNDLFRRMQSVSHKLNDEEISRLARHYGAKDLEE